MGGLGPSSRGLSWCIRTVLTASASMENRLYIGNLAGQVTASTLQELCERHGFVVDVRLVRGRAPERPRAFGTVTMATDESAGTATGALNATQLRGMVIRVEEACSSVAEMVRVSGGQA